MRINLVQGHSAGALLRQAIRDFGLPGEVRVIDDELSLGPLHDDEGRDAWWLTTYGPYPEAYQPRLYDQWKAIGADLTAESEILLWSSHSAGDFVFERMAAFVLRDRTNIFHVNVPASGKLEGVTFRNADELAAMEINKRPMTIAERATWAEMFEKQIRPSRGVRVLQGGSLVARPDDALDQHLLEHCPADWTKWYYVVGNAMADCDGANLISDAFFSWRLRSLVATGRVEAQGDPLSPGGPRDVLVRRAGTE